MTPKPTCSTERLSNQLKSSYELKCLKHYVKLVAEINWSKHESHFEAGRSCGMNKSTTSRTETHGAHLHAIISAKLVVLFQ